ncbi:hypothetical protein HYT51_00220 [Candidatus Woesearchaeota archaeon]|nr:hypothetical protein [Candidatus Woesearchaeota archaeon]
MRLQEDFLTITSSEEFRESNPLCLISCFLDDKESKKWEYNFYSSAEKEIFSFHIENASIVFKGKSPLVNAQKVPQELHLEELQSEQEEIFSIMWSTFLKEYSQDKVLKVFVILDQHEGIFWGFLILLKNLNIVHMKINDKTHEVVENSSISILKKG